MRPWRHDREVGSEATKPKDAEMTNTMLGIAIGPGVGLAFGLALGGAAGIPLGLAIGCGVGVAIGAALDDRARRKHV